MDGTLDRTLTVAAFVETMRGWSSEEVFEAEAQIRDLTEHPGWETLLGLTEHARKMAYARQERNGALLTQAQFALNTGWLSGLRQVTDLPDAVFAKAEKVRDELKALDRAERAEA